MDYRIKTPYNIGDKVYALIHNQIMLIEIEYIEAEIQIRDGEEKHRVKYYYKCKKENSFVRYYENAPYVYNTDVFATIDDLLEKLKKIPVTIADNETLW